MIDFIRETLSLHNLPVTMLLGMVTMYWLLVIVGILDNDFEGGVDGDVSNHGTLGGAGMSGGPESKKGGILNFGHAPLSIVGSFLAIFMWLISLWGNFYLNGEPGDRSLILAAVLLVPNGVISLLLTRVAVMPFDRLFKAMHEGSTEAEEIVGRKGRVASVQVDERYGQVEVVTNSAPLLVNARIEAGTQPLERNAAVTVLSAADDGSFYFVRSVSELESPRNQPSTP
ncbi:hypothetical protein FEM03_18205 [Phragmitibacter flavus]|uniref:DUF1449 family protein n=1 Tax=Phragmitibacter flavus TaxID=2576071 RepID=A0A5R8KAH4_9BACT|nr:hypothetical protein [Phragmitibacter flavus]TLD69306.1 hypothetical protein FEM03_18205 [Phragmitibacter flavus]